MNHLGLFEGIGGFSLAARWMGWQTVAWCEWNEFGQKVLRHHFPEAEGHGDITKTDFTKYANTIDILTGGFPCQPYSSAGKRLGKEDDRHLWPEMLRVIREVQPTWVVGENVFGLVNWSGGLVFDEVQSDLEAQGYEVQPYVLPAVSVNAPHRRDRVWFVAKNTKRNGCIQQEFKQEGAEIWEQRNIGSRSSNRIHLSERDAYNSDCNGLKQCDCQDEINTSERRIDAFCDTCKSNGNGNAFNTDSSRWQQSNQEMEGGSSEQFDCSCIQQDAFNSNCQRCKRSLSTGIIGQFPTKETISKIDLLSDGERGGKLQFQNFPTQSPICNGDDGLSNRLDSITFSKWRNESIKAGGNAIVPQVAYQIFKTIEEYEKRF